MSIMGQLTKSMKNLYDSRNAILLKGGSINEEPAFNNLPSEIESIPSESSYYVVVEDSDKAYDKNILPGAVSHAKLKNLGGITTVESSPNLLKFMYTDKYSITATPNAFNTAGVRIPAGTYRLSFEAKLEGEWAEEDSSHLWAYYGEYEDSPDSVELYSGDVFTITEEKLFYFQTTSFSDTGNSYVYNILNAMLYSVPDDSPEHILPTFIPYYEKLGPTIVSEIVSKGKNIVPDTFYDISNWQDISGTSPGYAFYLDIPKEGLYAISFDAILNGSTYFYLKKSINDGESFSESNSTFMSDGTIKNGYLITKTAINIPRYFEHKSGYRWILWLYGSSPENLQKNLNTIKNLQIEYIAPDATMPPFPNPTKYAPYHAEPLDNITIPDEVKDLDLYGYGVTDSITKMTYVNTVDFENNQYIKYLPEKIVFDGVNVKITGESDTTIQRVVYTLPQEAISNCALSITNFNVDYNDKAGNAYLYSNSLVMCPTDQSIDTVTKFNAWLKTMYDKGTPVEVVYAVAEPEITDISSIEEFNNIINIEDSGYLRFVNKYKNPVPSTISYLRRLT